MDSKTTINALKQEVKTFSEARNWDSYHSAKDLAIGIITESSELLEHFRFKTPGQIRLMLKNRKKRDEIGSEMADVFIFLLRLAQMNNFDLSEEVQKKLKKNNKRFPIKRP